MTDIDTIRDHIRFLGETSTHGTGRKRADEAIRAFDGIVEHMDAMRRGQMDLKVDIERLRAQIDDRDASLSVERAVAENMEREIASVKNVTISALADEAERLGRGVLTRDMISHGDRWRLTAQWLRKHLEDR